MEIVEARNMNLEGAHALVGLMVEGNIDRLSEKRKTQASTASRSLVAQKLDRIPVLNRRLQQLHIRVARSGVSKVLIGHATHSLAMFGAHFPIIDAWLPLIKGNTRVGLGHHSRTQRYVVTAIGHVDRQCYCYSGTLIHLKSGKLRCNCTK